MTTTQGEHAQTELAHELFAAAQLAPGEGIEDAVSRIAAALTAAPVVQAEPLHITHGPLMRHAAALLRSRKPVLPDHESVAAELELAVDGHPTPSGEPSAEWLEVARVAEAAQPAAVPQGAAYAALPDERGAFEALAKADTSNVSFERDETGYVDMTAALLWHGWQLRAPRGQAPAGATVRHLEAVIKDAADKLDAAMRCHPNAVETLTREAFEILHGAPEPFTTAQAAPAAGEAPAFTTGDADLDALLNETANMQRDPEHNNMDTALLWQECLETVLARLSKAPAAGAVAGPSRDLHPEKCPITGRPFFMTLDHPELGSVPTYGGPYDSYTIPAPEGEPTDPWHERELRSERYDHDAGWWVEGGEPIPLRIVHEDVLFKLQEDAEAAAAPTPAAQADSVLEDAARLDWLQHKGATVEVTPGKPSYDWRFRVAGLHATTRNSIREAIDAARKQGGA